VRVAQILVLRIEAVVRKHVSGSARIRAIWINVRMHSKRPCHEPTLVFPGAPQIKGGYIYSNDKPGLGVDIDGRAAAKWPYKVQEIAAATIDVLDRDDCKTLIPPVMISRSVAKSPETKSSRSVRWPEMPLVLYTIRAPWSRVGVMVSNPAPLSNHKLRIRIDLRDCRQSGQYRCASDFKTGTKLRP
jgi:hypothetical protein